MYKEKPHGLQSTIYQRDLDSMDVRGLLRFAISAGLQFVRYVVNALLIPEGSDDYKRDVLYVMATYLHELIGKISMLCGHEVVGMLRVRAGPLC